jgi:hypothetical protein
MLVVFEPEKCGSKKSILGILCARGLLLGSLRFGAARSGPALRQVEVLQFSSQLVVSRNPVEVALQLTGSSAVGSTSMQ